MTEPIICKASQCQEGLVKKVWLLCHELCVSYLQLRLGMLKCVIGLLCHVISEPKRVKDTVLSDFLPSRSRCQGADL